VFGHSAGGIGAVSSLRAATARYSGVGLGTSEF